MKNKLLTAAFIAPVVAVVLVMILSRSFQTILPGNKPPLSASIVPGQSTTGTTTDSSIVANTSPSPVVDQALGSSSVATLAPASAPATPGAALKARIAVGDDVVFSEPNQLGNFSRVDVGPKQVVSIGVPFPEAEVGDSIVLEVEDGGHLAEGKGSDVVKLDASKIVNFQFQTTDQLGIFRVALRRGGQQKVVNLWVN